MKNVKNSRPKDSKVYLVGSGIASLASAVYLVKDAGVQGKNIFILEKDAILGGSCDGGGDAEHGYVVRGGRMHEKHYECYWDLLSYIPSYDNPDVSVRDETFEFNERFVSNAQARLLRNGMKVDVTTYGMSKKDQFDLVRLTFVPEHILDGKRIDKGSQKF
ncbi:MAG: NAD(P)-binding protein [Desulfobulbaceae bacterium]|nr:NAD(P)-binding protein [Desulfobulbaceae bacterium]